MPVICPEKAEKEVLRTALPIERFCDAQHLLACRPGLSVLARTVKLVGERASDHGANDFFAIEGRSHIGDDMLAVAHDRYAVGDLQRFFKRMADEDN